jgi:hypothetical protein
MLKDSTPPRVCDTMPLIEGIHAEPRITTYPLFPYQQQALHEGRCALMQPRMFVGVEIDTNYATIVANRLRCAT